MASEVSGLGPEGRKKAAAAAQEAGDVAPSMATVQYWDEFYVHRKSQYDTLYGWGDVRHSILQVLKAIEGKVGSRSKLRVLHVGCGTSGITQGLWDHGIRHIFNTDYSEVVIRLMAQRWEDSAAKASTEDEEVSMRSGVSWKCLDVTDMRLLPAGSFDLVLEKFTLDAMLCEAKDDDADSRGCAAVSEMHRVLAPGGVLLSLAWGERRRQELLGSGGLFAVERDRLAGEAAQRPFAYICRKLAPGRGTPAAASSAPLTAAPAAARPSSSAAASASAAPAALQTSAQANVGSWTTSLEKVGGVIEVRVDYGAFGEVRPKDVEVDVGEAVMRWRFCHEAVCEAKGEGWHEVPFPCLVDVAAAVARWVRRAPSAEGAEAPSAATGRSRSRMLCVTAPSRTGKTSAL